MAMSSSQSSPFWRARQTAVVMKQKLSSLLRVLSVRVL